MKKHKWSKRQMGGLEQSIKIWEPRSRGETVDKDCPLCDLPSVCGGCPIAIFAGRENCHGTPFYDWHFDKTNKNAQCELSFLRRVKKAGE